MYVLLQTLHFISFILFLVAKYSSTDRRVSKSITYIEVSLKCERDPQPGCSFWRRRTHAYAGIDPKVRISTCWVITYKGMHKSFQHPFAGWVTAQEAHQRCPPAISRLKLICEFEQIRTVATKSLTAGTLQSTRSVVSTYVELAALSTNYCKVEIPLWLKGPFPVILAYDIIVTLDREIRYVWRRQIRFGSMLYLQARYGFLMYFITIAIDNFWPEETYTIPVMVLVLCISFLLTIFSYLS
jgi:hypothetical protein